MRRVCDVESRYGMAKTTVLNFFKTKDAIKAIYFANGSNSVAIEQRSQIMQKRKKRLIFIEEQA